MRGRAASLEHCDAPDLDSCSEREASGPERAAGRQMFGEIRHSQYCIQRHRGRDLVVDAPRPGAERASEKKPAIKLQRDE